MLKTAEENNFNESKMSLGHGIGVWSGPNVVGNITIGVVKNFLKISAAIFYVQNAA